MEGKARLGLAVLAVALVAVALGVPAASGDSQCGNIGTAQEVSTVGTADCNTAGAVVGAYYNGPCASGASPCEVQAAGSSWSCQTRPSPRTGFSTQVVCDQGGTSAQNTVAWYTGATGPPKLTGLTITPSAFKARTSGGPIVTSGGTRVSYNLSQAVDVSFQPIQTLPGRKAGPGPFGCKAPRPSLANRPRCVRTVRYPGFRHKAVAGANQFRFSGRVGNRRLAPGAYVFEVVPIVASGTPPRVRKAFRILRP